MQRYDTGRGVPAVKIAERTSRGLRGSQTLRKVSSEALITRAIRLTNTTRVKSSSQVHSTSLRISYSLLVMRFAESTGHREVCVLW